MMNTFFRMAVKRCLFVNKRQFKNSHHDLLRRTHDGAETGDAGWGLHLFCQESPKRRDRRRLSFLLGALPSACGKEWPLRRRELKSHGGNSQGFPRRHPSFAKSRGVFRKSILPAYSIEEPSELCNDSLVEAVFCSGSPVIKLHTAALSSSGWPWFIPVSNKIGRPPVLYSNYRESSLIRILPSGLAGLGASVGTPYGQKKQRGPVSLLAMKYTPILPPGRTPGVWAFSFCQGYTLPSRWSSSLKDAKAAKTVRDSEVKV